MFCFVFGKDIGAIWNVCGPDSVQVLRLRGVWYIIRALQLRVDDLHFDDILLHYLFSGHVRLPKLAIAVENLRHCQEIIFKI